MSDKIDTQNGYEIYSIVIFQINRRHYLACIGDSHTLELWKMQYDKELDLVIGESIFIML